MLNEVLKRTAWAILPENLEQIYGILRDHKLGELDIAAIEAKLGRNLANTRNVIIEDGIAVIPVVGPIAKRMNLFHQISGGTSAEMLIKEIQNSLNDDDIDGILLSIDSPGGTVDGTKEVGDLIYESRDKKPIWAFGSGMIASGAYWLASQASRVSAIDTTAVGSIGVVMSHYDYSKADENRGIKRTFITAGKYKRIVNDAEPLSDDGRAYLQTMLDDYYNLFLDAVAQGRGVEKKEVLDDMADGRVFVAAKALERGMIDAIESIDKTMALLKEEVKSRIRSSSTVEGSRVEEETTLTTTEGGSIVNLDELKKEHPKLVAQIQEETRSEVAAEFTPTINSLEQENERLQAGHDALSADVKELKKKDAIRTQNEIDSSVDTIWEVCLAKSDIPERLHPKVHGSVNPDKFIEGDKLDAKAFEEAVKAEIADWEGGLTSSYGKERVLGAGSTKKTDIVAEEDDSDDWTAEMLEMAGDKEAAATMKAN